MKKQISRHAGYGMLAAVLAFLIVVPILTVFMEAVMADGRLDVSHAVSVIWDSGNLHTIGNSILLGVLVVITSTIIATPLAFILVRTAFSRKKWLDIVLMIPFMTPPYISSMGWILFMQKRGLFQQLFPWTGSMSEGFFSLAGLTLAMSLHVFPFMTTILKNAMLNINGSLEESGAVFGGGFWYRLKRITMPLLTGNYAIGMLLVFVKTLSEYGTPATLGKRIGFYVFTTDIHRYATTAPVDFGKASSLSGVLIGICMVMWLLQNYVTAKNTFNLVGGKGRRSEKVSDRRIVTVLSSLYIGLILILSIGIPYFSVIATSLINLRGYGLAPGNFTVAHYVELFLDNPKGVRAVLTSLSLAAASATIASVLGTCVVAGIQKAKGWKKVIEGESLLPEMIPNIVLVIGLMLFWNKLYRLIPLYNTLGFMVLVYVVMFLPYTIQYVSSSMIQIGKNLQAAGQICGGSRFYVFRRITFPLVLKGIVSGWMMIFIISFRELVASSLIAPPNVLTVSTFIVREFEQGSVSVGMAMAVICVALTTTALILLNRCLDRGKH
ncbi:MAG: iron ABC transporter permease [Eubacteriales bacterium]|nr:iron ABC transporter permease [Eubacteriales bacterium]